MSRFLPVLLSLLCFGGIAFAQETPKVPQPVPSAIAQGRLIELRDDPSFSSLRIPPPPEVLLMEKGLLEKAATATVNYLPTGAGQSGQTCTTWPDSAKAAFTFAANIWASRLQTSVPITIDACWATNLPSTTLGSAGPTLYAFTSSPPLQPNTFYPAALINALRGTDVDTTSADIYAGFNSTKDWYFGTDGNPGALKDFVTVVLHEIGHGLGFVGSMEVAGGSGSWGSGSSPPTPFIFDKFTENGSQQALLTSFSNPSPELAAQLQSNNLFFDGTNANAANGGQRVPLYAPATWEDGSSYSHVAESFNGTANALMTYALANGETIHDPGPVALGILKDMGWPLAVVSGPFTLSVNRTGNGTVTSSPAGISCGTTCSASFTAGQVVTLTAAAAVGSAFTGWGGSCSGTASICQVTMDATKTVTATFAAVSSYPLTVTKSGGGSVNSNPSGITCGATCSANYAVSQVVTLTAAADSGFLFAGWGGDCSGTSTTCDVTMTAAKAVTATFVSATNPPRLVNISTRGRVLTGNSLLIGGFVISGGPKKVLVVARGPTVVASDIQPAERLADPRVTLVGSNLPGGVPFLFNDNWQQNANASDITATGKAPSNVNEAAILVTLQPGNYTAVVDGANLGTGIGIIEVYEIDTPEAPLVNISTRGRVLTGNSLLIGGFVVSGAAKKVLIVARGPTVVASDIQPAERLANPRVTLVGSNLPGGVPFLFNDNWQEATNSSEIAATGKQPSNALEAAILVELQPGNYTAVVDGANLGTGVGIIEVYAVQ